MCAHRRFVTEDEPATGESGKTSTSSIPVDEQVLRLREEVQSQIASIEDVKRQLERVVLLLAEESQVRLHAPLLPAKAPSGASSREGASASQHTGDNAS